MACMDLPETSVNAINKALAIEVEERTQTAERLIADLLATEGSNTAVYNAPSRPRYSEPELGAKQSVALQDREAQFEKMPYEDLTPVEAHAAPDRSHPAIKQRGNDKKESRNKKSHPALMLILSAVIAASLLGIVVFWIAHTYLDDLFTSPISSSSETENIGGIDFTEEEDADKDMVPRFVGANVDSIKSNEELQQRYRFVYEEEYNLSLIHILI